MLELDHLTLQQLYPRMIQVWMLTNCTSAHRDQPHNLPLLRWPSGFVLLELCMPLWTVMRLGYPNYHHSTWPDRRSFLYSPDSICSSLDSMAPQVPQNTEFSMPVCYGAIHLGMTEKWNQGGISFITYSSAISSNCQWVLVFVIAWR